jgi:hypothetical protein
VNDVLESLWVDNAAHNATTNNKQQTTNNKTNSNKTKRKQIDR